MYISGYINLPCRSIRGRKACNAHGHCVQQDPINTKNLIQEQRQNYEIMKHKEVSKIHKTNNKLI